MKNFLVNIFGEIWGTVIMSVFPLIELKGGIVFARGVGFGFFESLGLAYLGSTLVMIPVFFLLVPVLNLLKKIKFVDKLAYKTENYFKVKANDTLNNQLEKQNGGKVRGEVFYKVLGVFIFVAIPLPMTGVWTGTAIAVFLGLKFRQAILPIALGNLVAGLLIEGLSELCIALWTINSLDYILWGLFALAAVLLVVTIIKMSKSKSSEDNADAEVKENGKGE